MNELKTAMKDLEKAMKNLPEYVKVRSILKEGYEIDLEIVERAFVKNYSKNVKYRGFTPKPNGCNDYMLEATGELLSTDLPVEQLAKKIQGITSEGIKNGKTPRDIGFYVSIKLREEFAVTDEVYPHMRAGCVGGFHLIRVPF